MYNDKMHLADCKCVAWEPILVGALVALGLSFILNLFSVAIGLTAYTATTEGVETLAFGGFVGTMIGIVTSMFASGWLAGYLGRRYCVKRHLGALYGFLTWCVSLIVTIILTTQAREYVDFYAQFLAGSYHITQVSAVVDTTPTKTVVISSYIVFGLFSLSAIASSIGGYCGMHSACCDER